MSESTSNFYHQKTDAELLFFVENPAHYEPTLVEAALRELRRRGVALPVPPIVSVPVDDTEPPRAWGKWVAFALILLVLGGGTYWLKQRSDANAAAAAASAARLATERRLHPPVLTEVATSAIPSYDVAGTVARQLARIPVAERANNQHLRQFRELSRRFWTAETQTEYLTTQLHEGKAGPMFPDQTRVAHEAWQAWNQGMAYSYTLGPEMQAQVVNMGQVASSQQHILVAMPKLLPGRRYKTDKELIAREAEVQDWMAKVLPTSPVTGRPYKATLLKARM